ncbi:MAG: decaprenyl-phosphate phosphoribosyltransferase, partial [Proteobacteria bacterium]|nr:decaprenyl-phosphate phosphoribosyltransferase [Pseudomonadota bacterium]
MTSPPLNQTSPPLPLAAIKAMRPKQWAKNVFIFAALIFSLNFENPTAIYQTLMALCSFCCISSSGYIINDIRDIEVDRNHPKKQFRPLASGALPVNIGYTQAALLFCLGMIFGYSISLKLLVVALAYFTTTMSYSLFFKNIVVLDVMFIASGFIWRVVAGAVAINVAISPWLLTCTGFLALFLGFNKRRGELISMKDKNTRNNLKDYNIPMLQEFQAITTSGAIISY